MAIKELHNQINELQLIIRVFRKDYEQRIKQLEESIYRATIKIQDLSVRLNNHIKDFDAHEEPLRLDIPKKE